MSQQRLHRRQLAGSRGGHECRLAAALRRVWISTGIQEQFDQLRIAVDARQRQRRHAELVCDLYVRPGPNQVRSHFQIVVVSRPVERRHPIGLHVADRRPCIEQPVNARAILPLGRVRQRCVGSYSGRAGGKHR
jgi:hypothetical protein